jgi:hypothetical protein
MLTSERKAEIIKAYAEGPWKFIIVVTTWSGKEIFITESSKSVLPVIAAQYHSHDVEGFFTKNYK